MDIIAETNGMTIKRLELGSWATNSYIIQCRATGKCVVVDFPPGALTLLKKLGSRVPGYMLLTHNHIDHISGLQAFRNRLIVPLAVHPLDNKDWLPFSPEKLLTDGEFISVGNLRIKVLHTPGHTPGSVCFLIENYLISGDTLFPGGPGRTTTPEDFQQILKSITKKIFVLPGETWVYPGHGVATTVKKALEEYASFTSRSHPPGLFGDVEWKIT